MKRVLLAAALLCAILAAAPASADVIYDNGAPDGNDALLSTVAAGAPVFALDDFTLAEGSETITDVHWWGAYYDSEYDPTAEDQAFGVLIVPDDGGLPDLSGLDFFAIPVVIPTVSATGNTVAAVSVPGDFSDGPRDVYEYSAFLDTPITLTPGVTYWLSIIDLSAIYSGRDPLADPTFAWSTSAVQGGNTQYSFGGFVATEDEMAFQLTNDGVVPEPASILLMGFGLAGVAWRTRKKRS